MARRKPTAKRRLFSPSPALPVRPMPFDDELLDDGDGHQRQITIYATQDGVYRVNGRSVIARAGDPLLILDGPLGEIPIRVLGPFPHDPDSESNIRFPGEVA